MTAILTTKVNMNVDEVISNKMDQKRRHNIKKASQDMKKSRSKLVFNCAENFCGRPVENLICNKLCPISNHDRFFSFCILQDNKDLKFCPFKNA